MRTSAVVAMLFIVTSSRFLNALPVSELARQYLLRQNYASIDKDFVNRHTRPSGFDSMSAGFGLAKRLEILRDESEDDLEKRASMDSLGGSFFGRKARNSDLDIPSKSIQNDFSLQKLGRYIRYLNELNSGGNKSIVKRMSGDSLNMGGTSFGLYKRSIDGPNQNLRAFSDISFPPPSNTNRKEHALKPFPSDTTLYNSSKYDIVD